MKREEAGPNALHHFFERTPVRRFMTMAFLLGLFVGISAAPARAETMYAKKDRIKVTAQKSPMSKVVATLQLGDSVQVLEKSGRHYKVRVGSGKKGWVFKFRLSPKPVSTGEGGDALAMLSGESGISAREARSGGSIRGLEEATEEYAKNKQIDPAHKESVERMERYKVLRDELIRFQQEGSVGEFAGGGL